MLIPLFKMKIGQFLFGQFCVMLAFFVVQSSCFMDIGIIRAYFKEKNTSHASLIGCFTKREKKEFTKKFILGRQAISVLNIDQIASLEFLETNNNRMGIVVDGDCDLKTTDHFLRLCGTQKFFDVKHHWLVLSSKQNFSTIFNNVETYINADVQIAYLTDTQFSKNVTIQDVYNSAYGKGGELKTRTVGYYNEREGYVARENQCKYWIRKNMTGVTLKSHIVLPVPFEGTLRDYLNSRANPDINTFNRFHHNLMCSCVNYYNFTANVTQIESWGYLSENGTWDGMVGALENRRIDYGSSAIFVRPDRAKVIEYSQKTWTYRAAFVFRNPKIPSTANVFFKPLSLPTWITIVFAIIFVICFLKLTQSHEKNTLNKHADTTWSFFIICTLAALCQQGLNATPLTCSGRIITMSLLILSLMVYQFYAANLLSTLLIKPETRVKTIEDLLTSDLRVGCEDTLYNRDHFKYAVDQSHRDLYAKKMAGKGNRTGFLKPGEGLALVKDGGYAFHVELCTAYPIIEKTFPFQSICQLREVQMYRNQPMYASLQKHSAFRDMFDTCLQRLAENGVVRRELTFWHPREPQCIETGSVSLNMGLDYFYPSLLFLAMGMFLSLLILALEVYIDFKNREIQMRKHLVVPVYSFSP